MIPLDNPELKQLAKVLRKYKIRDTVSRIASLLTVPSFHANALRIEVLVHLAVIHCRGTSKPSLKVIERWLNDLLGNMSLKFAEDPAEDVFITNVRTPEGNRRLFEGIWLSSCYFTQTVIDILCSRQVTPELGRLLAPILTLLKLSEIVADRVGLQRWHSEPSYPQEACMLSPTTRIVDRGNFVSFTSNELTTYQINPAFLEPFILKSRDRKLLLSETLGHTSLERYPLLKVGKMLVLALPNAVGPAIRRFLLGRLQTLGLLPTFAQLLNSYQSYQIELEGINRLEKADSTESLSTEATDLPIHDWLLKVDVNRYLHVVLLNYPLKPLHNEGLDCLIGYRKETEESLCAYLNRTVDRCMASPGKNDGTTLLVTGGLGGNCGMSFRNWANRWSLSVIHISDFLMLVDDPAQSIIRFLKFINQKKWAEKQGVKFTGITGDYTVFCYWLRSGFQIVSRELSVSPRSVFLVDDGYTLNVRTECRRTLDRHLIRTTNEVYVDVKRLDIDTYFHSLTTRPVYGSIDHGLSGVLAGVIETRRGPSWFSLRLREKGNGFRNHAFQFWHGFIDLFYRVVVEYESQNSNLQSGPIEVCLDLTDVVMPEVDAEAQSATEIVEPRISVQNRTAVIELPAVLLKYFQQPENIGETYVVKHIAKALIRLHTRVVTDFDEQIVEQLTDRIVNDAGIRIIHVLTSYDRVEQILQKHNKKPVLLAPEDFAFTKLKLSEDCLPSDYVSNLDSRSACKCFLNKVVAKIWSQIRSRLKTLDRASVLRNLLYVHENILHDRNRWRRTANAVQALYGPDDDVHGTVHEREGMRSITDLSTRTILEMAICECPEFGGNPLSQEQLDEFIAKAALMHEVAAHSDGIKNKLINPPIELHQNGSYSIEHEFINTVIEPFLKAYATDDFGDAASKYHTQYQNRPSSKPVEELYPEDFIEAFEAEFQIPLQDTVAGFAEIFEMAIDNDDIVVKTTLGEIRNRLASNRGFSETTTNALITAFSIFHRPKWDSTPPGMTNRDIQPWRYSRRLSIVFKPILVFGKQDTDAVIFGVGTLQLGFRYLLYCLEEGYLPQEFFRSDKMRSFIGGITDKKGHDFTVTVAEHLSTNGWQTRTEIPMTQIGASSDFGDIDVLAWKPNGAILIIECKRLRLARTVAEISEICRRFRGEAKDELFKHMRRVNWIETNSSSLNTIIGMPVNPNRIDQRLITNIQVPMRFLSNLPIPNDKIGPLDDVGV
ncbi:MAG: hypothetical protein F4Y38_02625 [Gemmatimonadetes bacterium]|nr:hypothetical protein [Gemmatimonadota bacterium]MYG84380.1 hypothetical protein [Gemmatimonadota bacterium]MYJ88255.1 hypothetical protein [Gemmatimonadota bacterium]